MNLPRAWPFLSRLVAALYLASAGLLASAHAATGALSGTTWRLVQFQGGNGQTVKPDDESNYTAEFRTDNTVAVRLDCNRGRGTWVSRSASHLELGPLALTRGRCPHTALHDQIAKQWELIRSYALRDTHLFLSLMADGGTYEFEPEKPATAQSIAASWLDQPRPVSWNTPGAAIPGAPKVQGTVDPRCRTLARSPELEADKRLTEQGWDLIGGYQGGWGLVVIRGAAGYDGMCRPWMYQDFVFSRGAFLGTLSPGTMNSRTDGALNRVTLQDSRRLVAEYARYTGSDPLCCPSKTARVVFEIGPDQAVIRPVSALNSSIDSSKER